MKVRMLFCAIIAFCGVVLIGCSDDDDNGGLKPGITRGTFTDPRDRKVYPIVKIGFREWFAKNLNYETENSLCAPDDENCEKYGRFYDWYEAMEACPEGWKLPRSGDWRGYYGLFEDCSYDDLMAVPPEGEGTNACGFNALPVGYWVYKGFYDFQGNYLGWSFMDLGGQWYSEWWSENTCGDTASAFMATTMRLELSEVGKGNHKLTVRCVR